MTGVSAPPAPPATKAVTIRSGDGQGQAGLVLPIHAMSGYIHDLTVEGFDYGVDVRRTRGNQIVNPAIEYITLRGQHTAGIHVTDGLPPIRALDSHNAATALIMDGTAEHVLLIDSVLTGGAPDVSAIDLQSEGHLFLRNVDVQGYGMALRRAGEPELTKRHIVEYVSDPIFRFDMAQIPRSLDLPVADPPPTPWPIDLAQWASVDDYGAVGDGVTDDYAAIQAACDSVAAVVHFPSPSYRIDHTVEVPSTVERLALLFTTLMGAPDQGATFRISEPSAAAIIVEDLQLLRPDEGTHAVAVDHHAPRTLVMDFVRAGGVEGASAYKANAECDENGDLFLNNVNGFGKLEGSVLRNQRAWARWINTESVDTPNFLIGAGAALWVLSCKVEKEGMDFDVFDGGVLELLGGYHGNRATDEGLNPNYRSVDGHVYHQHQRRQLPRSHRRRRGRRHPGWGNPHHPPH